MAGKSASDLIIRLLVEDEQLDKVDKSKAKFDEWDRALGGASKMAAGTLLAIGGAGVAATVAYANAEAGLDQLAGSLALSADQAGRAGEAAANAYANAFGSSLEEVQSVTAGVIGSIAGMRDASVQEIQGITEQVLTLSAGFEIEADRVSQVVGQMLSTGLAGSAQQGIDLLTAALQRVPPAVRSDVLDAVDEYGPFFASIGMSGEAAMSALVDASSKGMYGIDKTGDAVKEFSIRATDMSTTSVAAYEAAGLSAEDMAGKILAGGEAGKEGFRQVIDGLLGIEDPVVRANAAIGLFGTPLEDLGVNEIPAFLSSLGSVSGSLGEVEGAAAAMGETLSGNSKTGWEEIRRTVEVTAIELGESLKPAIDVVIGGLQDFAAWARDNTQFVQQLAIGATILGAAILTANAAFRAMMFVQAVTTTIGMFRAAQAGAAIATGAQTAATSAQTTAQWANNAAWLASPVTWIVLAIIVAVGLLVAAGIWLVNNWDSVVQWLGDAWNWLWGSVLSPVFSAIGSAFEWLGTNVFAPVGSFIGTVVQGIGDVFTWLYQNIILPVVTGIMLVIGLFAAVVVWLWENVAMPVFGLIGQGFQFLYQNVFVPVGIGIDQVVRAIAAVLTWISQNVFAPFGSFVGDVVRNVGSVFSWLYANAIVPIGAGIAGAVRGVGAVFSWLWTNAVMPAVRGVGDAVNWVHNNVISPVFSAISGAVGRVGDTFRSVFGSIGGFIAGAFGNAVNAVRGPVNAIIGLVNKAIRGLNGISLTIPDWVPMVGGQSFGVSLPQVPYLATGGVTMGPMLAVVGDNPGGREYIEPVDKVASRMERVALEAAVGNRAPAAAGPVRLAREDLEYVAQKIGETVYPLIIKGAQGQIRNALGV